MKKVISMILALVLVLSMSITAFAAESHEVKGNNLGVVEGGTVYAVDIAWGSMEFTYEVPADVWNGEEHKYETTAGTWTCASGANVITVTNRSNAAVNVSVTTNVIVSGITASAANGSFTLGSAAEGATTEIEGKATEGEATVTLSGALTDKTASNRVIGSVTVTVSDANAAVLTEEEVNAAVEALKNGKTVTLDNVSAADHAAIAAALDETYDGALMSKSMQGLSTTYTVADTFNDALSAWTDGTTLTMLGDANLTEEIGTSAQGLVLDLNGHNIECNFNDFEIRKYGTLTVRDSKGGGYINGELYVIVDATLYLESGNVKSVFTNGDFIMTGGCVNYSYGNAITSTSPKIRIVISGGEVTGRDYAVRAPGAEIIITGSAKINGGTSGLFYNSNGTTTITGGTFNTDPSQWVDTENYTVTESGGLWTVTAK